jgi:atypical dual specificity phosphatase
MAASDGFIHWVTKSAAGLRQPGLHGELAADLTAVRRAGIDVLVSLTGEALPQHQLLLRGINGRHFPIVGMGVPMLEPTLALCEELAQLAREGSKIAFHCTAGVGRTGMMLACHLVSRGIVAPEAIVRVRAGIPRAIQTKGQEAFVQRFAETYGQRSARARAP